MDKVHMVEQVIKYSDGSETVIKYRGVIEDGVLIADAPEHSEPSAAEEEPVSVPEEAEEEVVVTDEVTTDESETSAESVEDSEI